jgi:prepilin-type N-terminal cleavage/methylation domain-containing protein
MKNGHGQISSDGGFTLIEVLVALSVLGLLLVMVLSMLKSMSLAISNSDKRQEAVSQARQVLNRIGVDLASQIRRQDIPYGYAAADTLTDYTGNDTLAFFTEGKSYNGTRQVIEAAYRINTASYTLERAAVSINWTDSIDWFLPVEEYNTFQNTLPKIQNGEWQEISPLIFRFEVCFLSNDPATGVRTLDTKPPSSIDSLVALVVTVAVLDSTERAKITTAQVKSLADALPDPGVNVNPLALWEGVIQGNSLPAQTSVPRTITSAIRCFQQYFPFK